MQEKMLGYMFRGQRYDAGDKVGFLQANIAYALQREEYRKPMLAFMKETVAAYE
jgi:UTP--glucose-1-phosphate uridylyltransferase